MQIKKQINENILVLKKQSDAKILFSSLNLLNKIKYLLLAGLGIGMIALSPSILGSQHSSKIGVIKIDCVRLKNTQVNCKIFRSGDSKFSQNNSVKISGILKARLNVSKSKYSSDYQVIFTVIESFQKDNMFIYKFDSHGESKSTFESINNFLNSKEVSFSNSYDRYGHDYSFYNIFLFFLFLFVFLFGLCNLLIAISFAFAYEELLLNKLEMQLTYTDRAFLEAKVKQYAFTDITKVDLLPNSPDKNNSISFVPRLIINYEDEYRLGDIKDHQTALEFVNNLNKFIGLPEEYPVRKSEAESLLEQEVHQYHAEQYESALQSGLQALEIYQEISDYQGEIKSRIYLCLIYNQINKYDEAIEYGLKCLYLTRKTKDRESEVITLNNLAVSYNALGNYNNVIDYAQLSLIISRELQDQQMEGSSLLYLGLAYYNLGEYDKSISYYQQCVEVARRLEDISIEEVALNNIDLALHKKDE